MFLFFVLFVNRLKQILKPILHLTASEIRMVLEDAEGNVTPIRCCIENVSGGCL